MGLYNLRQRERAAPLFKLGRLRFGQISYPIPLQDGEVWRGQLKFKHTGPAEVVRIVMGPYVAGVHDLRYTTMNVGEDIAEKEYTGPEISGPYESRGLPHCRRIDTDLAIRSQDGAVTHDTDTSTERFHNVAVVAKMFEIIADRYGSPAGWGAWAPT